MPSKDNIQNDPKFHSNTVGQSKDSTAIVFHNAESAGMVGGIAGVNDTTSSDQNSAAAVNKGPQPKAVQVTVAGNVRLSNPA